MQPDASSAGTSAATRAEGVGNAGLLSNNGMLAGAGAHAVSGSAGEGGASGDVIGQSSGDGNAIGGGAGGLPSSSAGSGAGSAGGAGAAPCVSRVGGAIQAAYFPDVRLASTQDVHPFIQLTGGEVPIALERVSIRYYFTNESALEEAGACFYVSDNWCKAVVLNFMAAPSPTPTATRALEVRFAAGTGLFVGLSPVELHLGFAAGSSWLRQSNDYSFDSSASSPRAGAPVPYKRWDRILVYVDDVLAWGTEPCQQTAGVSTEL